MTRHASTYLVILDAGLVLVRTNPAMAYWRSGDPDAAERSLAKTVELSPGFAPAVEALERIRRSRDRR